MHNKKKTAMTTNIERLLTPFPGMAPVCYLVIKATAGLSTEIAGLHQHRECTIYIEGIFFLDWDQVL